MAVVLGLVAGSLVFGLVGLGLVWSLSWWPSIWVRCCSVFGGGLGCGCFGSLVSWLLRLC